MAMKNLHQALSIFRFNIIVNKDYENSSHSVFVEYFGKNNSYEGKIVHKEECIYSGSGNTSNNVTADVILNVCKGLEGMIRSESETIFIQPVKNNELFPLQHIIYRRRDVVTKYTKFSDYATEKPFQTKPFVFAFSRIC
ncbi:A disintegrin and metalloproteinase with thrombospondin motifs 6-like isoform X4 [Hydractinia symbiolongicarpus]|uniref:A disintegrin and metalloproteinase with thrombospondin motifs 6-like isoform X4 n=1 Tax=Hydractinia symbiolongicarpus TaxID=13093 RepID=UPI00254E9FAD|nr:A disintegrin and metalloproteinase with thrombospondin motifs 6-like isoform X4 [Hydractinia symbiolongicarpus]